mgnify:FL=1
MNVKQFSEQAGLSPHTIRYYDKLGLFPTIRRTNAGYRDFSNRDLNWIVFIKKLKTTGMAMVDIQRYVDLVKAGDHTQNERRAMLVAHQQHVQKQMEEWKESATAIDSKIEFYEQEMLRQPEPLLQEA